MSYSAKQLALALPNQDQGALTDLVVAEIALDKGLKSLISNPKLTFDEKKQLVSNILSPFISKKTLQFIDFLIQEQSLEKLPKITREYQKILEEKSLAVAGEIITANPMTDEELKNIEQKLSAKLKMPVIIRAQTDPSIIGGAIIKIGSKTIDNSYKTRLKALRS